MVNFLGRMVGYSEEEGGRAKYIKAKNYFIKIKTHLNK